jgi:flagellar basal body-associated protein FliL
MANPSEPKKVKKENLIRAVAFAVAFILVRVVFSPNKDSSNNSSSNTSQQEVKPYTSVPDKFTVNFDGTPGN